MIASGIQSVKKSAKRKLPAYVWVVVAVLVLAVTGGALLLMRGSSNTEATPTERKLGLISETEPQIAKPQPVEMPVVTNEEPVIETPVAQPEPPKPKSNSPWANKPPRVIKMREADIKPRRFVYDSEEDIAALLEIEPGTSMFGDLPYNRFERDFKQAIMQRVKINPDDDEYTQELKRQVQAVKDDLKGIMLNGGDVAEEMRKARNELKEMGRFRDSLMRELHDLRKSGEYSSQDIRDFETAANKMLEEKGLKPLKVPAVLLRNMELKERRNQQ